MTYDEALEKMIELFAEGEDVQDFINELDEMDDFDEFSDEIAFRAAVISGNYEYVSDHITDIELNDEGGCTSSYLQLTDDESIRDILLEYGAGASFDDYIDYKFAYETVNDTIVSLDGDFQVEIFKQFLDTYGVSEEKFILCYERERKIHAGEIEDEGIDYDAYEGAEEGPDCLEYYCKYSAYDIAETFHILVKDGKIIYEDATDKENGMLSEILEDMGYEFDFEGSRSSLETCGVYYID